MSQNTGSCPVCEKEIRPGQDAVVCPDCGTPYHRECYLQAGNCVHKDKHGTGFEYTPPERQHPGGPQQGEGGSATMISCQNCGARNSTRNIFCESCGATLHGQPQQPQPGHSPQGPVQGGFGSFGGAFVPPAQDLGGDIDGIPKTDWVTYVGQSNQTYIPRMAQQQRSGHRFGFLLSAFFIPEIYFGFRKMWGWGALALAAMTLTLVPDFMLAAYRGGVNVGLSLSTINLLGDIAFFAALVLRMAAGIFSVYMYRRSGGKRIKKLREQYPDHGQYQEALRKKGGVSWPFVIGVFVFYAGLTLLLQYTLGIDLVLYLTQLYL